MQERIPQSVVERRASPPVGAKRLRPSLYPQSSPPRCTLRNVHASIRSFSLPGPAGPLEALLNEGLSDATHAAVVCHPHPLYGGTLHNKVVFHTTKALNAEIGRAHV